MKKNFKYESIYRALHEKILHGEFADGKLPPLSKLAEDFNTSLVTVNKAVKLLENNGIVNCSTGRGGTQINRQAVRQLSSQLSGSHNTWCDGNGYQVYPVLLRCLVAQNCSFPGFEEIIRDFKLEYPWIDVNLELVREYSDLKVEDYDIIQGNASGFMSLISGGFLADLGPYAESVRLPGLPEGPFYGLPLLRNMPLMYFNKKHVASPPASWEEYMSLNRRLKDNGLYAANMLGIVSFLHFFTGNIILNRHQEFFKDALKKALSVLYFYYNWKTPWNNFNGQETAKAVREQAGMALVLAYSLSLSQFRNADDWQVAPLPGGPGKYLAETIMAGLPEAGRKKKDAWLFLKYLYSGRAQRELCRKGIGIPGNSKVFHGDFREHSPQLYDCVKKLLPDAENSYVTIKMRNCFYMKAYPVLERYFSDTLPQDEAIRLFLDYTDELLGIDHLPN